MKHHLPSNKKKIRYYSPLFTEERKEVIFNGLKKGMSYRLSSERAGVHLETFRGWVYQGLTDMLACLDTEYVKFVKDIREIEGSMVENCFNKLLENGAGCQWILEKRFWKDYTSQAAIEDFDARLKELEKAKKGSLDDKSINE